MYIGPWQEYELSLRMKKSKRTNKTIKKCEIIKYETPRIKVKSDLEVLQEALSKGMLLDDELRKCCDPDGECHSLLLKRQKYLREMKKQEEDHQENNQIISNVKAKDTNSNSLSLPSMFTHEETPLKEEDITEENVEDLLLWTENL